MNKLLFLIIILFTLEISAQDTLRYKNCIDSIESLNISNSKLCTGFYLVKKNIHIFTLVDKVIEKSYPNYVSVYKGFWIFKREIRKDTIVIKYKTTKQVDTSYYEFDTFNRFLENSEISYKVIPRPITLKENIIRIYDSELNKKDSFRQSGLSFKLNYLEESLICDEDDYKKKDCYDIGLIINNELVAINSFYSTRYIMSNKLKYINFFFSNSDSYKIQNILNEFKLIHFKTLE